MIDLPNNFEYREKSRTIILPVQIYGLPEQIQMEGFSLLCRTTFHVSLVPIGEIVRKNSIVDPGFEAAMLNEFNEFCRNHHITFKKYLPEFRFAREDEKRSVVIMCEVSELGEFFARVSAKFGLHLESPPTHATLYTLQPNVGIFLTDSTDLDKLTKMVEPPVETSVFGL